MAELLYFDDANIIGFEWHGEIARGTIHQAKVRPNGLLYVPETVNKMYFFHPNWSMTIFQLAGCTGPSENICRTCLWGEMAI
ncbi:MAG: hypothetical protein GY750_02885 [Lentisphaerae bacterium]|nr:hypothetical protein [Lentisphaerota bacterium]